MFFADESTGTGSSEFEEALTEAKEEPSGEDEEESSEETTEEGEKKPSFEEVFADALKEAKEDVTLANEQMKKEAEGAKKPEKIAEELTGEESTGTAEEPIDEATERANAKIAADKAFWDNQKKRLDNDDARGRWSSSNDNVVDYIKRERRSKKLGLPALSVSGMKNYDDITAACNFIVTLGMYTFGFQSVSGLEIRKPTETQREGGVNDHAILCGVPESNEHSLTFKRGLLLRKNTGDIIIAAAYAIAAQVPDTVGRRAATFAVTAAGAVAGGITPQTVLENGPTLGTIQVFNRERTRLQGLFSFISLGMTSWRADDLDASNGNVWCEEITIAHTGLTRHAVDINPFANVSAQGTNDSAYSARNEELYANALGRIPPQVQAKVYSYQEARSAIEARRTQQLGELAEAEEKRKALQAELMKMLKMTDAEALATATQKIVPKQSATVTTEHKKGDATPVDADLKAKDKLKKDDNK